MILLSNYCPTCLQPSKGRYTVTKVDGKDPRVDRHQLVCVINRLNGHNLFDLKAAGAKCSRRLCSECCMVCAHELDESPVFTPVWNRNIHERCATAMPCGCFAPNTGITTPCPQHPPELEAKKRSEACKAAWGEILRKRQKVEPPPKKKHENKGDFIGYVQTRSGLVYQRGDGTIITDVTGCDDIEQVQPTLFFSYFY